MPSSRGSSPPRDRTRVSCGSCTAGGLFTSLYYVLVAELCPTLCNPMDCSLPGSSVHGILQTRILEWVAISFSMILCYTHVKNILLESLDKGTFKSNSKSLKGTDHVLTVRAGILWLYHEPGTELIRTTFR